MEDHTVTGKITGELTYMPEHISRNIVIQPQDAPKLELFVNAGGKLDAKYDPEDLTEVALMLISEVRRLGAS